MKRAELFKKLRPYFIRPEMDKLECAYNLAKLGHGYKEVQERESGERYFEHPKEVLLIIFDFLNIKDDIDSLIDALLHDGLEDVYLLIEMMIVLMFGESIAKTINFVSKNDENKPIFFKRLLSCGDWRAVLVKIADRIHNMRDLGSCGEAKQKKQVAETRDNYFKLCDYLETIIPSKYAHAVPIARKELERLCTMY